jgi:glyoxylase-like metal-dependent hydrolase (beta-lactamase superfamily II)
MTGTGNNTYLLVAGNGGATLIDAGQGREAHLSALTQQLSRQHARLERVLVTHAHSDHISGASALADAFPHATFHKHRWPGHDGPPGVRWHVLNDADVLDLGDGDTLVTVHTPGHSPDHLAFWHRETRTLFSGDLVVAHSSVMIHGSRGGDLAAYLASLERVRALAPALLLPAHGGPIERPDAILAACIDHRLHRERQILESLTSGHRTMEELVECIYDGLNPALLPAARETMRAHLDKLRREGRVRLDADRWFAD